MLKNKKLNLFKKASFIRNIKIKKSRNVETNSNQSITNSTSLLHTEYSLDTFHRSNQDTCLVHKPAVFEGQWVESGDLLADCSSSIGGELSLGHNILIAYLPWEGYNFEDAILISERLVFDDLYTSIHIERYDLEIRETKFGVEKITSEIPDVNIDSLKHLHSSGIAKIGSWVEEGDILVGKTTPVSKKKQSPYQQLLYTILDRSLLPVRDTSFRAPKGIKAKIIGIQLFKNTKYSGNNFIPSASSSSSPSPGILGYPSYLPSYLSTDEATEEKGNKTVKGKNREADSKSKELDLENKIFLNLKKQTNSARASLSLLRSEVKKMNLNNRPIQQYLINNSIKKNKLNCGSHNFVGSPEDGITLLNDKITNKKEYEFTNDVNHFLPRYIVPQQNIQENNTKGKKKLNQDLSFYKSYLFKKSFKFSQISTLNKIKIFSNIIGENRFNWNATTTRNNHSLKTGTRKLDKLSVFPPSLSSVSKEKDNMQEKDNNLLNNSIFGNISSIQIYLAEKRRTQIGDKMAGRHGNKGIISQILPIEDMPFLPDGTPLDMVLNPLGVPSRMNVGQIYECLLGLAGKYLGEKYKIIPFDEIYGPEASRSFVYSKLNEAVIKTGKKWIFNPKSPGKLRLYDGRTGESFNQTVTVGYAYMLRLVHMVDDKIHARSTGPYSLVTQQPLRGRSKVGGQRLGEMEVWALEGYGAAFTLLEMLTIKSDDMSNRMTLWSNLILNKELSMGTPESFKVLICELQALCLDIGLFPTLKNK